MGLHHYHPKKIKQEENKTLAARLALVEAV
jgi:hypothetical protein